MAEILDIVDAEDRVHGTATRPEIYTNKFWHRIAHVFVIDPATERVFIQKRSATVGYLPGYYCTSAGGHVLTGENYEQATRRELHEEIGISAHVTLADKFVFSSSDHHRHIALFIAYTDKEVAFNDGEVSGGEFMTKEELRELISKGELLHPQLIPCAEWLLSHPEVFKGEHK